MNGRQFIARVRRWARQRDLEVHFVASEIGKGLLNKMLADLGIDSDEF